jgi:sugar phosphate isomerase/epimerase
VGEVDALFPIDQDAAFGRQGMQDVTRREWHSMVIGGLAAVPLARLGAQKAIDSRVAGVQIGAQSYSFRDLPLDDMIAGMAAAGIGSCELWQGHVEPRGKGPRDPAAPSREAVRQWRLTTPLDHFRGIRKKFDNAGIRLTAYNLSFRDDYTDEEIARGFEMAKALGVDVITASSNVTTAKKVDPFAKSSRIKVGLHNHSEIRPNEFATAEDFATAMKDASEFIAINLDIGHFTAANFDAVDFLDKHHDHIVSLHIKDRKRNQGDNVPFGEGDTPIGPVLARLRDRRWPIPANIEYEYKGADTVAEMRRCFDYCKQALSRT